MGTGSYVGSVKTFAFQFAPRGYLSANGQTLAIAQYNALFALLGTTYGGNGTSTFALPNLGGRVPVGQGQAPGISHSYVIGETAGTENVTLMLNQMPQHNHGFVDNGSALNALQAKGTVQAPTAGARLARPTDQGGTDIPQIYVPAGANGTAIPLGGLNVAGTITTAGGSQPHSNMQPYLTLNFCICSEGLYPSRN